MTTPAGQTRPSARRRRRLVVALTRRGGVGRPGCGESSSRKAEPFGTCSEPSNGRQQGTPAPTGSAARLRPLSHRRN